MPTHLTIMVIETFLRVRSCMNCGQVAFKFQCCSFCTPCSPLQLPRLYAGEMVRQARVLAQATSDLVNAMRSDAEAEVDVDNSKKLLAAAKLLADATARMVEAAKVKET